MLIQKLIDNIKNKYINENSNCIIFDGKYENNNFIIKIKLNGNLENFMINNIELNKLKLILSNDRFNKYILENIILTTIYPALDEDVKKYTINNKYIIKETYEDYLYIKNSVKNQDLKWINNILEGREEQETILFQNEYFILIIDLFTDNPKFHCLAIVKDSNLKSIRDLTDIHIPLLENIKYNSLNVISKKYNINKNKIRAYFHYHPSFWHLHVHFNSIDTNVESASIDRSYKLNDIITNIKISSNYYQKVYLDVVKK